MCSRKQVSDTLKRYQPLLVKHAKRNKVYTAYVRNLTKDINKKPWKSIIDVERCSDYNRFTWSETPEGNWYWYNLNVDILNLKSEI